MDHRTDPRRLIQQAIHDIHTNPSPALKEMVVRSYQTHYALCRSRTNTEFFEHFEEARKSFPRDCRVCGESIEDTFKDIVPYPAPVETIEPF